jgi:hypothetical protein
MLTAITVLMMGICLGLIFMQMKYGDSPITELCFLSDGKIILVEKP